VRVFALVVCVVVVVFDGEGKFGGGSGRGEVFL
jgi:hypothetical protein